MLMYHQHVVDVGEIKFDFFEYDLSFVNEKKTFKIKDFIILEKLMINKNR